MDNYRVLVIDPDSVYADSLISELRSLNSEIDIERSLSASQAKLMINTNEYDVLVCESSQYHEGLSGKCGVIVLLSDERAQFSGYTRVNYCLVKPVEPNILMNRIVSVILGKKSFKTLDERISMILLTCGISPHIRGFRYLRDAIKLVCSKASEHDLKVTKDIYPAIALATNTAPSRIERGIRHAIESAWERGKLSGVRSVIGLELYDQSYKPTNWEFIKLISDKLILENERENVL